MIVENASEFKIVKIRLDEHGERATVFLQSTDVKRIVYGDGSNEDVWISEKYWKELGLDEGDRPNYPPDHRKMQHFKVGD